jgi:hypothetical protein
VLRERAKRTCKALRLSSPSPSTRRCSEVLSVHS